MIKKLDLTDYILCSSGNREDKQEFLLHRPPKETLDKMMKEYSFLMDYGLKGYKVYVHKVNDKQIILREW